jgi:hypothetical protein
MTMKKPYTPVLAMEEYMVLKDWVKNFTQNDRSFDCDWLFLL